MNLGKITFLLLIPIILSSIPLNESFTGTTFPPLGWRVINNDGGLYSWERYTTNPRTLPACASSKFEGSGIRNDDWLITPRLICSDATADTLKFWYRKSGAGGIRESLEVRLSNTGNNPNNFTTLLWAGGFTSTTYNQKILSLDGYDDEEIYIAFVNKGLDQARINLDDITGPEVKDISGIDIDAILEPGEYFVMRPLGACFQPQVKIKNYSNMTQRNITVTCSIVGQTSILRYENTKYLDSLLIDSSKIITFDSFTPVIAELCTVKFQTLVINDTNQLRSRRIRKTRIIRAYFTGGPDVYYSFWIDSDTTGGPVYNWTDISQTGDDLPTGNEYISGMVPIDFSFNYYGEPESCFRYSTNGFISFSDLFQAYNFNAQIPNVNFPNNLIAPFWDDLWTIGAWHQTFGTSPNRYKIIQWHAIVNLGAIIQGDTVMFQLILHENGDIIFQYNRCDNRYNLGQGQSATIGIEDASGTIGLQYLYNGTPQGNLLSAGRAIRFYRSCHDVTLDSILTSQVGLGDTVNPKVLVKNIGTSTESFLTIFNIFDSKSLIYIDTLEVIDLLPATSCTLSFDEWIAPQYGTYSVKAWTTLDNDFNRANDTCWQSLEVSIPAPILLSPSNGSATNNTTVLFDWTDVMGATRYNFQVLNNIDTILPNSHYGPINFPEGNYNWQVRGGNQTQWGFWSQTYSFTIDITPPPVPILVNPVQNCTIFGPNPYFIWYSNTDAFIYNLIVYSSYDTIINITLTDTTCISTNSFGNGQYFWKVRCQDRATNWSGFSQPRSFFVYYAVWFQKADFPEYYTGRIVKDGGCLASAGNKLYALKGNNTSEFYVYDITTNQWSSRCSIPFSIRDSVLIRRRVKAGAALVYTDSLIYAIKGNNTKEFWVYYPNSDTWVSKTPIPSRHSLREGSSLTYNNGFIYCLIGSSPDYEFYRYDINQNTWIELNSAPTDRTYRRFRSGSCVVYGGQNKIYALKGSSRHNEFYVYDINNNLWDSKESLPYIHPKVRKKTRVKSGGAMTYDGANTVYAIKGGRNEFWTFNTSTGHWSAIDTIPRLNKRSVPRNGAALAYSNGQVWLLKGNNTKEFWSCIPPVDITESELNLPTQISRTDEIKRPFSIRNNKIVCFTQNQTPAKINYTIPKSERISINLYDIQGRLVKVLKEQFIDAGDYCEIVSLDNLAKGVYFIVLDFYPNRISN